jgi:NADH:ubiquinone oxidoreductase subunit 6 (subunit J)
MNILSEIIDLLSSIFIPATFVAMVIHTNKLVTRKKLSNALRFFVLTGVFFPIVSIGIWVYAIYAKPGNRDQRLRYRLIPNILAGTVLSGALLFLIVLIMSMDATHSDEIPVKEIDFNKMQENLGIKFDPQNATVDTAFFDNFFRSSDSFYKLRLNDE